MKVASKIAVSLCLLTVIVWSLGGLGEVGKLIEAIDFVYLVPIVAVATLDRALMAFKWARLLSSRGVHLPFLTAMKLYCASMIWGAMLPSTVGPDAIRAIDAARYGLDSSEVIASIVVERMVGFLCGLLLGLLSLLVLSSLGLLGGLAGLWWLCVTLLVAGTVALGASFSQTAFSFVHERVLGKFWSYPLMRRLREFHMTYQRYRDDTRALAAFFVLTFAEQWLPIPFAWLIAVSMGIEVNFILVVGVIPLTLLLSRIPVGVGNVGVYEGVFVLLMSLAGMSAAEAVAIALVSRIVETLSWSPWWLAHVFWGSRPASVADVKSS